MKFLFHFYDFHQRAGIQRAVCELANALIAAGHDAILFSGTNRSEIVFHVSPEVTVEVFENPEPRETGVRAWPAKLAWAFRQRNLLRACIRKHRPTLVVDHGTALGLVYPRSRLAGVPFALQRHFPARGFPNGALLYRTLSKFTSKPVIVLTDRIAAEMRLLGYNRVFVIPNPIPKDAQSAPYSEAMPQTGLLLGRARNPQKGFDLFLQALSLKRMPGWRFWIVGPDVENDPLLRKLIDTYDLRDRVELMGPSGDPYALIRRSACVIMPSRYEGLPMVALEALSIGRPVIGADVDGLRDVIQHGVNGILFPGNDPEQLAYTLARIEENGDNLRAMASNAPGSVERFRASNIVAQWCRIARLLSQSDEGDVIVSGEPV